MELLPLMDDGPDEDADDDWTELYHERGFIRAPRSAYADRSLWKDLHSKLYLPFLFSWAPVRRWPTCSVQLTPGVRAAVLQRR